MTEERVCVTTVVALSPDEAFELFTTDVDSWWRREAHHRFGPRVGGRLAFEDGRFVEHFDDGSSFVMGDVLTWEPGATLAFELRHHTWPDEVPTRVRVRFEPESEGTRVTLEHLGIERWRPEHPARRGLRGRAFADMLSLRWADELGALRRYAARRSAP